VSAEKNTLMHSFVRPIVLIKQVHVRRNRRIYTVLRQRGIDATDTGKTLYRYRPIDRPIQYRPIYRS
jgi:hypothetical protein